MVLLLVKDNLDFAKANKNLTLRPENEYEKIIVRSPAQL